MFHGGSSLRKFSKKIRKVSKFQKCPKLLPKVSKRVLNMFWGNFSKNFRPVFHGRSSLRNFSKKSKKLQNSKNAQNRSQKYPNVFGRVWGKLSENFCPVFHGMSSLQKFSKKNIFKIPKMPKSVPKRIQTCFRVIFFEKV